MVVLECIKYLNCVNFSSFGRAINMLLYAVIQILGSNCPFVLGYDYVL